MIINNTYACEKHWILACLAVLISLSVMAHPMPHTVVVFDIHQTKVTGEIKIPLMEMQYAFNYDITHDLSSILEKHGNEFCRYMQDHFSIRTISGELWRVQWGQLAIDSSQQEATGRYAELICNVEMSPPKGFSPREFIVLYDAVIHQLVPHKVFVTIRNDFASGRVGQAEQEIGLIYVRPSDSAILPLVVRLNEGSNWVGFCRMVKLGIDHIMEGTDHILFLITLLLPATLLIRKRRWGENAGIKASFFRLLKLVTAFTIGHSLSLTIGVMKWLMLPSQGVEIAITFTILFAAVHAIVPIFGSREVWIAIFFGLIHGLAFATLLTELNLTSFQLIISIVGYNAGIEIMQVFIILCIAPIIIILSKNNHYTGLRIVGACFAIVASIGWGLERLTARSNWVSSIADMMGNQMHWILLLLILAAAISIWIRRKAKSENLMNL